MDFGPVFVQMNREDLGLEVKVDYSCAPLPSLSTAGYVVLSAFLVRVRATPEGFECREGSKLSIAHDNPTTINHVTPKAKPTIDTPTPGTPGPIQDDCLCLQLESHLSTVYQPRDLYASGPSSTEHPRFEQAQPCTPAPPLMLHGLGGWCEETLPSLYCLIPSCWLTRRQPCRPAKS